MRTGWKEELEYQVIFMNSYYTQICVQMCPHYSRIRQIWSTMHLQHWLSSKHVLSSRIMSLPTWIRGCINRLFTKWCDWILTKNMHLKHFSITVINPDQEGCTVDRQCSGAWPSAKCVNGKCVCPDGQFIAETQDGLVCFTPGKNFYKNVLAQILFDIWCLRKMSFTWELCWTAD